MAETPKKKRTTKKKADVTTSKSEIVTPQVDEVEEVKVEEKMAPKIVSMPPAKCVWRKSNDTSVRLLNGRKVKPNEVFEAYPEDIPVGFRDMFTLLEGDATIVDRIQVEPAKFKLGTREDGLFDVVDESGKAINDEPLEEVDAQRLLIALTT